MKIIISIVTVMVAFTSIAQVNMNEAPIAKKIPVEFDDHGDKRLDNYHWMRLTDKQKEAKTPDSQTKDVVDYLTDENSFTKKNMEHTNAFQKELFEEMVSRIRQDDASVPYLKNGYNYYTRFEKGEDYPLYCRKKVENGSEEIMLNGPIMGEKQSYFEIGETSVSPDNKLIAYGVDLVSRREYIIYIKNLETGEVYKDKIKNTTGYAVWANDNKTIFYTRTDPITLRSYRIYKHVIGTNSSKDELVFEEEDETFSCWIDKSKSGEYIFMGSWSTLSSETKFLNADDPNGDWKTIVEREPEHEYSVSHFGNDFYIITNTDGAKNFKLVKASIANFDKSNWKEVIGHRKDVLLETIDVFKDYYVLSERKNGLNQLRVINWEGTIDYYIEFNDPTYMAYTTTNVDFNTEYVRYEYTSLTTPSSTFDFNMRTKEQLLKKQTEVMDENFSSDNYVSERIFATARDGVKIPISIVYRKGTKLDGSAPLLMYGYGSYGSSEDAYFSSVRLSILDRGFIYAIAHIRGGQEMGREWYEDGKLLKKKNTFNDFIDCAEHLLQKKYTSKEHLYALGGSAGGLLMGAIINMRPDLWNGIIAAVPFVDVVSTMLDETIPLTTGEFDEWGNPKDEEYYYYMKSYSPYDNVEAKSYPNMLVTTGYWDSQVQYWEPAKWVAKLRDLKTDNNLLYLHCNMDVGHGGASGRFERFKEYALEYAFLLDLEGISK